ncbi:MAG: hypothetical protein HFI05_09430 [Lachnospiraceae bacterium]|nr:hypothetical protein [Lachnospiraceae bacterium]
MEGYITSFEIIPTITDDREELWDIIKSKNQSSFVIFGNKDYIRENLAREIKEQKICFMTLKRPNSKIGWSKAVQQLIFKLRK